MRNDRNTRQYSLYKFCEYPSNISLGFIGDRTDIIEYLDYIQDNSRDNEEEEEMNYNKLRELLERHEGKRARPYQCSAGKTTIGIGHNLDDNDLSEEVIQHIFTLDIKECISTCYKLFKTWQMLPDMKQVVLANMAFQLGYNRLSGFKKLIAAVNSKDWQEASRQMLDSKWARQVPNRANELAEIMRN